MIIKALNYHLENYDFLDIISSHDLVAEVYLKMALLHGSLKTYRAGGCQSSLSHLLTLNDEICTTNSMGPIDWSLAGQTQRRCAPTDRTRWNEEPKQKQLVDCSR